MSERTEMPPVLKWVGGKRWLVPRLVEYYDKRRRLVDPFVGGMSVPLGLRAEQCSISDINPHLINLYRWLQAGLVWDPSDGVDFTNTEAVYYRNRDRFNELCDATTGDWWTKEGALLFYYLNRSCFNGLCRFNEQGKFNAAYGKYKKLVYTTDFSGYREAMAGWEISYGTYLRITTRSTDFIYADPPYDNTFTRFATTDFTWDDQVLLATWLAAHPGPVITSNAYTERIVDMYTRLDFKVYIGDAPRKVSCDGNRASVKEILAMKNI